MSIHGVHPCVRRLLAACLAVMVSLQVVIPAADAQTIGRHFPAKTVRGTEKPVYQVSSAQSSIPDAQSGDTESAEQGSPTIEESVPLTVVQEVPFNLDFAPADTTIVDRSVSIDAVPGELIVCYQDEEVASGQLSALAVPISDAVELAGQQPSLYGVPDGISLASALAELQSSPKVLYAEPNFLVAAESVDEPDDPRFAAGEQWALEAINAPTAWAAHEQALTAADPITVAVLDTGVDENHEDLVGRLLVDLGRNFATHKRDGSPYTDPNDFGDDHESGYGTKMAGIIAAAHNNSIGISGVVGPASVNILPVKVLNNSARGTVFDLARGIRYAADQGAKVIVLSVTMEQRSQTLATAIRYAQERDALVVASVGERSDYPYPGAFPGMVTAGALNRDGGKSFFAASGDHLDLLAPGLDVLTTARNNKYGTTRAAADAAHVAGAASLYRLLYPQATQNEVAEALNAACSDLADPGWDAVTGHGRLDLPTLLSIPPGGGVPQVHWTAPASNSTAIGQVQLQVEVVNAATVAGVSFSLDGQTPADLLQSVPKASTGQFYSCNWDSTTAADGAHTLFAQAYADDGTPLGEAAQLALPVLNQPAVGLTLRIVAPNGAAASGARLTLYRRTVPGDADYDPEAIYLELDEYTADAAGLVTIPGKIAINLHSYTALVRGRCDTSEQWVDFFYVRQLQGPTSEVLEGSSAVLVNLSMLDLSGQRLPYARFILQPQDSEGTTITTLTVEDPTDQPMVVYLDAGLYDAYAYWSPGSAYADSGYLQQFSGPTCFLEQKRFQVSRETTDMVFSAQEKTALLKGAVCDHNGEAKTAILASLTLRSPVTQLFDDAYACVVGGTEIVAPPGEYSLIANVTHNSWHYDFQRDSFTVASPEVIICQFGGPLTLTTRSPGPLLLGDDLRVGFELSDSFGNLITRLRSSNTQVSVSLMTYDANGGDAQAAGNGYTDWMEANVTSPIARTVGDWRVQAAVPLGPLFGNTLVQSTLLPFSILSELPPPAGKTVQVYGWDDQPAGSLDKIALYSLLEEDGVHDWVLEATFVPDAMGKIFIPADTSLSTLGNLLTHYRRGQDGYYRAYSKGFLSLDELSELRLGESNLELTFSVNDWQGNPVVNPSAEVYLFPQAADGKRYALYLGEPTGKIFVVPGDYSFLAEGEVTGQEGLGAFIWQLFADIRQSQAIELSCANPARLSLATAAELAPGFVQVASLESGAYANWYSEEAPVLYLTPGEYSVLAWPYYTEQAAAGSRTRWFYGVALCLDKSGTMRLAAGETHDLTVGGRFAVDLVLHQTELTAADTLRGDVLITDPQGNRLLGVYLDELALAAFSASDYGRVDVTGQLHIQESEFSTQSYDWPYVLPFLSLYRLEQDGTETCVFSQCADRYFYDLSLPLSQLAPGDYRVQAAISLGEQGVLQDSERFRLSDATTVALDSLLPATNQLVELSGLAAPNASITVFYYLDEEAKQLAGTATADSLGRFSLQFAFPEEAPGGNYHFTAQATIGSVTGSECQPVSILLDRVAPAPATDFRGESRVSNSVSLSWTASGSPDVAVYRLLRDGIQVGDVLATAAPAFQDSGLTGNSTYHYVLVAVDQAGNASQPVMVSVTTAVAKDEQAPAKPAAPSAYYQAGGTATVSWQPTTDNVGVVRYALFRYVLGEAVPAEPLAEVDATCSLQFTDSELLASTSYCYSVRAYDAAGNFADSDVTAMQQTPALVIGSFSYHFPSSEGRMDHRLVHPGAELSLRLLGEKSRQAAVEITCLSALSESGTLLDTPVELVYAVNLSESSSMPGTYACQFNLPDGVISIAAMRGVLTDGEHSVYWSVPNPNPNSPLLRVTADLAVKLPSECLQELIGLTISVWSGSVTSGQTALVQADKSDYLFSGLLPASDYAVRIRGRSGRDLVQQYEVAIVAGQPNELQLDPGQQAQLVVRVQSPAGLSLSGVNVYAHNRVTGLTSSALTAADGLAMIELDVVSGENVDIRAELPDALSAQPWEPSCETAHLFSPGANLVTLTFAELQLSTITGVATVSETGAAFPGATVTAVRQFGQRSVSTSAITDVLGRYTLLVPAGNLRLTVGTANGYVNDFYSGSGGLITAIAGQVRQLDLPLSRRGKAQVDLVLRARYLDREEILLGDMAWWIAPRFAVRVTDSQGRTYSGFPLNIRALPNEQITISVDGKAACLSAAEQALRLDENRYGATEIVVEEYGRIVGRLADQQGGDFPLGPRPADWMAELYQLDDDGRATLVSGTSLDSNDFSISTPGPGQYMVKVRYQPGWSGGAVASAQATVGPVALGLYELVDVGNISPAWGITNAQGALTTGKSEVSAGAALTVTATFGRTTHSPLAMEDTRLRLDLPAGCELVPGGASFNGQQVFSDEGSALDFSLGDVSPDGSATQTFSFQVKLNDAVPSAQRLLIAGSLEWTEGTFDKQLSLVPAEVRLAGVTLDAPSQLTVRDTVLSGRAPVGATIEVYDDDLLLGITETSAGGYWRLPVSLPDWGSPVQHVLIARTDWQGTQLCSERVSVLFDPNAPLITKISLQQGDSGQVVTFNPAEGMARFPYSVRPSAGGFNIALTFNRPELVRDVHVAMPPFSSVAEQSPNGDFVANIQFSGYCLGPLHVEYQTRQDPSQLAQSPQSEAEGRLRLPPELRDTEVTLDPNPLGPGDPAVDWTNQNVYSAAMDFTMPDSAPRLRGRTEMWLARDVAYRPTAAEWQRAYETGVPVYGLKIKAPDLSVSRSNLSLWVEGYIAQEYLETADPEQSAARLLQQAVFGRIGNRVSAAALIPDIPDVLLTVHTSSRVLFQAEGSQMLTAADWGMALLGGAGYDDVRENLGQLMDAAYECGASKAMYEDQINALNTKWLVGEGLKAGLQVLGTLVGPATFGLGTLALFGASLAAGMAIDSEFEDSVQQVKDDIASNEDCKRDDDEKGRKGKKVAEPDWIWDPSGIVYAGVIENPVQDVKATLYQVDPDTGKRTFWKSEWYGQQNPLFTDGAGYYGWDVPVGQWQVVYEKDGYASAQSEVLPVPPPQTEVNINLTRLVAPQVIAAEAAAGGDYVQLVFDQFMLASSLNGSTVMLTSDGEEGTIYVPGAVQSIETVPTSAHPTVQLTRKVRFVPDAPLSTAGSYSLIVADSVQSYGGIALGSPHVQAISVPGTVQLPADAVGLQTFPKSTWIDVNWTDPAMPYLQIRLTWSQGGAPVGQAVVDQGVQHYQIANLFSGTTYDLTVATVDSVGNESAGLSQEVTTQTVTLPFDPNAPVKPPTPPVDPGPSSPPVTAAESVSEAAAVPGDGSIAVSWQDPAAARLQRILVSWRPNGSGTLTGQRSVTPGVGNIKITGLQNGTLYEVELIAIDRQGRQSVAVTLLARPLALAAGTELASLDGQQHEIILYEGELRIDGVAGAFGPGTNFTARRFGTRELPLESTLMFVSQVYHCAAEAAAPLHPLTISLQYDAALLGNAEARQLGIYRLDDAAGQFVYVGGALDLANRRLSVQTGQLGTFAVLLRQPDFGDTAGHWGERDINIVAARGLAVGVGAGQFDPDREINRAELLAFMVRLAHYGGVQASTEPPVPSFTDVPASAWYSGVATVAARLGIIAAGSGALRPQAPATREEMAAMLLKVMELLGQSVGGDDIPAPPFTDLGQLTADEHAAVARAWYAGLMGGIGGSQFQPQGTSTRSQVAAVMLRVLERTSLLLTSTVIEGRLQVDEAHRYQLVDCTDDESAYRLAASSELVRQQLAALIGARVSISGLLTHSGEPALSILGVSKSESG